MTRIEGLVQSRFNKLRSVEVAPSNTDNLNLSNVDSLAASSPLLAKQDQPGSDLVCEPCEPNSFCWRNCGDLSHSVLRSKALPPFKSVPQSLFFFF